MLPEDVHSLYRSDSALATTISMVLVIALIASVITIIHVSYVPEWKTDAEHVHMDDVWDDMSNLKSNIDILSVALAIDPNSKISMSTPIKMGGGSIPIVGSGKSSGSLSIKDKKCSMKIVAGINDTGLLELGTITYRSNNNYYIDQTFEYENGALIVAQNNNSLMKLSPGISIQNNSGNINVSINAIEITGNERRISSNTIEEVYLDTGTSTDMSFNNNPYESVQIVINTEYPDAWERLFNSTASNADLVYGSGNDYTITSNSTSVTFDLTGDAGNDININGQKNTISARLDVLMI